MPLEKASTIFCTARRVSVRHSSLADIGCHVMEAPSSVPWTFKPDTTTLQSTPSRHYHHASPSSLSKLPLKAMYSHSPSTSQIYTSPLTPRSGSMNQLETPYRAGSASPHNSAGLPRSHSTAQSQDLLLPMMPSTEDSKLHVTVSGLRFALQESQLHLSHAQQQVSMIYFCSCTLSNVYTCIRCCMLHYLQSS